MSLYRLAYLFHLNRADHLLDRLNNKIVNYYFKSWINNDTLCHGGIILLVVAGVASLGGTVPVAVRSSLLMECLSVGYPPPRTVWYHKQNIITHHPRYTRNNNDSLLINSKYLI